MKDEEFEKYFERIEEIFTYIDEYKYHENKRKAKLKEILAEIEKDNYRAGYEMCEMDIADEKEIKP
jgi:c-di-AMP phosphodiesterase-like protein